MKIIFLNIYYEQFLKSHYKENKIAHLEYMEQWDSVQGMMFGDSDFYSRGMSKQGWETHDLITNCKPLQMQWARENDYSQSSPIWVQQVRKYQPDVVYAQGLWLMNADTHSRIKDSCKLIVGQVGSQIGNFESNHYDLIFTSHPEYPEKFREAGVESHYLPLAFDPRVWEKVKRQERDIPISFVGQLTSGHMKRKAVVGALAGEFDVQQFVGNKWGLDMFDILARSYMTINCSHDYVAPYGGNMRLYEATGCGALTLNEDFKNMLFEDDEVLAYKGIPDAIEKVRFYLRYKEEGETIAERGQKRTLKEHTYDKRMEFVAEILEGML